MACKLRLFCFRGEMDIMTVFGTVGPGSNPGGSTKIRVERGFLCSRRKPTSWLSSGFE